MKKSRKKPADSPSTETLLLLLVADIRAAIGDPTGKLMQNELILHCRRLKSSHDSFVKKIDLLQEMQQYMREPERTIICDILANGSLLPDPTGERYGLPKHANKK